MAKNKTGECAYCGMYGQITRDHIPPKSFFSEPKPSSVITVPCCPKCNQDFQKDDDYFETLVTRREDVNAPYVKGKVETLLRPEATGLKNLLLQSSFWAEIVTDSGLFLGFAKAIEPNFHRLYKTIEHIIKGLYYYQNGHRLGDRYFIKTLHPLDKNRDNYEDIKNLALEALPYFPMSNPCYKENDFSYKNINFALPGENSTCLSVWLLTFYKKVPFISFIFDKNSIPISSDKVSADCDRKQDRKHEPSGS